MKSSNIWVAMLVVCLFLAPAVLAQQEAGSPIQTNSAAASSVSTAVVPQLIKFNGTLLDADERPMIGMTGVTFALYSEQTEGASLWMETQNVKPDANGNYTVLLGAASKDGVPAGLFSTGEAHWLGIQVEQRPELPRVLLVSVPYALKAADATTLGGLPASAFALAGNTPSPSGQPSLVVPIPAGAQSTAPPAAGTSDVTTTGGTVNKLAKFDKSTDITSSLIFDNGTDVGIGNTTPAAKLDVSGAGIFRGFLELPSTGTATAAEGASSQPFDLFASSFNSSTHAAVSQHFRWQAESVGNDTTSPSGKLNLLFASGTGALAETGLSVSNKGLITFASGQAFPTATGNETVTGNLSAQQLISNLATGTPPLSVKSTTLVPNLNSGLLGGLPASAFAQLAAANTFIGNQTVNGNVSATGVVSGSGFQIGSNLFAFGSYSNENAFLGFAGNTTTTGSDNTATGYEALLHNTTGSDNTASGRIALYFNTTGYSNTATGYEALLDNTTGDENTADGLGSLGHNTTGSSNTASGAFALNENTTGSNNTADGYDALLNNTTTGSSNTATGYGALLNNTTGSDNTASGADALSNNSTGNYNTALGFGAGPDPSTPALTNSTAIGAFADVTESYALVLGSSAAFNGVANVSVGIDVTNPTNILTVLQGGGPAIADGWNTYSSRRWKTNIQPLQNALGKIEQLRGVLRPEGVRQARDWSNCRGSRTGSAGSGQF
jgi:hypothetical protein